MVNEAGSLPNQPSAATVAKIKYLYVLCTFVEVAVDSIDSVCAWLRQRRAADMRLKAKKYQSQKKNDRKHSN